MKPKNLLRGFRVQNFKAIRDSRVVPLTPLTVLIGNNGSGKSSFVEGMETYRNIVTDGLESAMQRWFGFEHVLNKSTRRRTKFSDDSMTLRDPIRFAYNLRCPVGSARAELTASARSGFSAILIEKELVGMPDRVISRGPDGRCTVERGGRTTKLPEVYEPGRSALPKELRAVVSQWQFLGLLPEPMGKPAPKKLATNGHLLMNKDGSNLAQYLLSIREKDIDTFDGIVESMKFVVDYAKNFEPVESREIQRMMYVQMREAEFEIPGWLISTGTIRILALLAVLRNPDPPPLIVIEEIENGLDPRTIHMILEEIRTAVQGGQSQIILTTHSPYFLDLLPLQTLVLVERENGGDPTFWRPSHSKEVQSWAKRFAPGQLYSMDRFTREVES
jgi:predicted ATPase